MRSLSKIEIASLTAILASIAGIPSASAECTYLTEGLQDTMGSYRAFRDENQIRYSLLTVTESECKSKGGEISGRVAEAAVALTCEAQKDASALNREIAELGKSCESVFSQQKTLQLELKTRFELVRDDLAEAMKILRRSKNIQRYCGDEVKVAETMTEAFLNLEGKIINVQNQAASGAGDYNALKASGESLRNRTLALNANCGGNQESAALPAVANSTYGQGAGQVAPRQPSSASDLTGTNEAIEANRKSANAIERQ